MTRDQALTAYLRHLADNPALNVEQAAMLRHCANRIEAVADVQGGIVGYANVHEFNAKNDGYLVVRPAKAASINGTDSFLTVPLYAGVRSST